MHPAFSSNGTNGKVYERIFMLLGCALLGTGGGALASDAVDAAKARKIADDAAMQAIASDTATEKIEKVVTRSIAPLATQVEKNTQALEALEVGQREIIDEIRAERIRREAEARTA